MFEHRELLVLSTIECLHCVSLVVGNLAEQPDWIEEAQSSFNDLLQTMYPDRDLGTA